MTKSRLACEWNLEGVFGDRKRAYLWTFTFEEVLDLVEACRRWGKLSDWFKWYFKGTVWGVRVYELHEEHGLHVHAVVNRRVQVDLVRPAVRRLGFGRIHVKQVDRARARYVLKYLGKQYREPCLRGRRMWACFGGWKGRPRTLVKNVVKRDGLTFEFQKARLEAGPRARFEEVARHASTAYLTAVEGSEGLKNPYIRRMEETKNVLERECSSRHSH